MCLTCLAPHSEQGDAEDSIRTNAIIFLGKVAAQLKPAVRDKVLLPAFARGVKDPFVATRLAGLRATAACHQHFRAEEVKLVFTVMVEAYVPCARPRVFEGWSPCHPSVDATSFNIVVRYTRGSRLRRIW